MKPEVSQYNATTGNRSDIYDFDYNFASIYTGPSSTPDRLFCPYGITTDSQCRILTADSDDNCIHTLDQDGHFLRYINNIDIDYPWGLCVDIKDNLFVGELCSGKVKKIKFIM